MKESRMNEFLARMKHRLKWWGHLILHDPYSPGWGSFNPKTGKGDWRCMKCGIRYTTTEHNGADIPSLNETHDGTVLRKPFGKNSAADCEPGTFPAN